MSPRLLPLHDDAFFGVVIELVGVVVPGPVVVAVAATVFWAFVLPFLPRFKGGCSTAIEELWRWCCAGVWLVPATSSRVRGTSLCGEAADPEQGKRKKVGGAVDSSPTQSEGGGGSGNRGVPGPVPTDVPQREGCRCSAVDYIFGSKSDDAMKRFGFKVSRLLVLFSGVRFGEGGDERRLRSAQKILGAFM